MDKQRGSNLVEITFVLTLILAVAMTSVKLAGVWTAQVFNSYAGGVASGSAVGDGTTQPGIGISNGGGGSSKTTTSVTSGTTNIGSVGALSPG